MMREYTNRIDETYLIASRRWFDIKKPLFFLHIMAVKTRSSNIELYRIIIMLLIVAHHYVVNSGVIEFIEKEPFEFHSLFFYVLGMWGKIGINCFVLITGYFMCTSQISLRKYLKLIFEIEFYNISIYLLFTGFGYSDFSIVVFLQRIWLVWKVQDGFTTCFLLFYLFIPFLNVFVKNLTYKQHLIFLILTLSIYSLLPTIPKTQVDMNYLTWFCILYMISAFIRKYNPLILNRVSNWTGVMITLVIAIFSVVLMRYISILTGKSLQYFFVIDVNKIVGLAASIILFNYFRNIKLPYSEIVNRIAATTFGIYLIHTNCNEMREWLWKDLIDVIGHYNDNHYVLYACICIFAVFVVCSMIDYIRMHTVEKWVFYLYDKMKENNK